MNREPDLLFGKIATAAGYLTAAQVQLLVDAQAQARGSGHAATLGELAQERGLMTSQQVQRTLLVQEFTELREDGKRLGALAVKNGLATEEQIARALEEQQQEYRRRSRVPRKLGEILVAKGFLAAQQLDAQLSAQGRLNAQAGAASGVPAPRSKPLAPNEVTGSLTLEGGDGSGRTFAIGQKAVLGRIATCEVVLGDVRVSRQHARIQLDPTTRQHVLSDLNTPNGTLVNGERIRGNVILKPGDRIQIGVTSLRYEAGSTTAFAGMDLDRTMADLSGVASQAQAVVEARHDTVVMSPPQPRQPTRPPTRLIKPAQARTSPGKPQPVQDDFLGLGTAAAATSRPAPASDDEDFLRLGSSSACNDVSPLSEENFLGIRTPPALSPAYGDDDLLGVGGPPPGHRKRPPANSGKRMPRTSIGVRATRFTKLLSRGVNAAGAIGCLLLTAVFLVAALKACTSDTNRNGVPNEVSSAIEDYIKKNKGLYECRVTNVDFIGWDFGNLFPAARTDGSVIVPNGFDLPGTAYGKRNAFGTHQEAHVCLRLKWIPEKHVVEEIEFHMDEGEWKK